VADVETRSTHVSYAKPTPSRACTMPSPICLCPQRTPTRPMARRIRPPEAEPIPSLALPPDSTTDCFRLRRPARTGAPWARDFARGVVRIGFARSSRHVSRLCRDFFAKGQADSPRSRQGTKTRAPKNARFIRITLC